MGLDIPCHWSVPAPVRRLLVVAAQRGNHGRQELLISRHVDLSDDVIERSDIPANGEIRLWDQQQKGLHVRVWPSGRKSFCVRWRSGQKTLLHTIGIYRSPWNTATARIKAAEFLASNGTLPGRTIASKTHEDLTVDSLIEKYLIEGPLMKMGKRASSWKIDAMNLNRHVRPLVGHLPVIGLKKSDVAGMLRDVIGGKTAVDVRTGWRGLARVRGGRGSAERTLTTLKAMLNWAITQELLSANPAKDLSVPKAQAKERFLSDTETARLFTILKTGEGNGGINKWHASLIRLLLLTGARKSELMAMRWEEVDLTRSRILVPADRTKSGRHNGARRIPLSGAAKAILDTLNPIAAGFVFPSAKSPDKHMTGIQKTWKRVCQEAQLGNMRLHDLRHSFASFAIANGENIVVIADVLGHASTRMTERYLHLRDDHLNALSERTGQRILAGALD